MAASGWRSSRQYGRVGGAVVMFVCGHGHGGSGALRHKLYVERCGPCEV